MRIIILTQDENLYLPTSYARVCRAFPEEVVCIVSSPAMSTHGGAVRGFVKHLTLFGVKGTWIMGTRVIKAKLKARMTAAKPGGPFHSIKQLADAFEIPHRQVPVIRAQQFHDILDEFKPELLVSISCPQIIGKEIRRRIPLGCINVHSSPLPKYRGLMPTFWVLRNGEKTTATSVHDLMAKLDDGDILLQRDVPITPQDTWDTLVRKTKAAGAQALIEVIEQLKAGTVQRRPNRQEDGTYFSFPTAHDRRAFQAAGRSFF